ncbi:MAG: hypothetical protein M8354_08655 [Halalkalicoccus sp.]|nr:hypothetical protein [Halalkalicoccus sp.]
MTRQRYHEPAWRPIERFEAVLASLTRYDLLLVAIPAAVLLAFVADALAVGVYAALVGAALVGALVVADAFALNPPRTG